MKSLNDNDNSSCSDYDNTKSRKCKRKFVPSKYILWIALCVVAIAVIVCIIVSGNNTEHPKIEDTTESEIIATTQPVTTTQSVTTTQPPTTIQVVTKKAEDMYYSLGFGQTIGSQYIACFHPDGSIIAVSGILIYDGKYKLADDGKLIVSLGYYGDITFVPDGNGGYRSSKKYPMMVGEDYYSIFPADKDTFVYRYDKACKENESEPTPKPSKSVSVSIIDGLNDGEYCAWIYPQFESSDKGILVKADIEKNYTISQSKIDKLEVGDTLNVKSLSFIITDICGEGNDRYFLASDEDGFGNYCIIKSSGKWIIRGDSDQPLTYTVKSGMILIPDTASVYDYQTGLDCGENIYGKEMPEEYKSYYGASQTPASAKSFFKLKNIKDYFDYYGRTYDDSRGAKMYVTVKNGAVTAVTRWWLSKL